MRDLKRRSAKFFTYCVLSLAVFSALFPIFWTITTSLKKRVDTFSLPPKFFNFSPTLDNYKKLFSDPVFLKVYLNTALFTFGSAILSICIGSLAAYAIARNPKFHGKATLEIFLILLRAMPGVVLIVPLYDLCAKLHLLGQLPVLIVIITALNLPFTIWMLTPFFAAIPLEIEEAGMVDGLSTWQIFRKIVVPLALPGISAAAIFLSLLTWNEFLVPVILGDQSTQTLPVFISGFISARTLDWGPMAAASSLAIIPIAALTVFVQRKLVVGLSFGALKE
jgi:ABC-type glycerol-3-phosphate transport system permease component